MTEVLSRISGPDELRKLNQKFPERYPFLLQSTAQGGALGRFDILFAFPGESLVLTRRGELEGRYADEESKFLHALDAWWDEERSTESTSELPFHGGWFLYLGYELAAGVRGTSRCGNGCKRY